MGKRGCGLRGLALGSHRRPCLPACLPATLQQGFGLFVQHHTGSHRQPQLPCVPHLRPGGKLPGDGCPLPPDPLLSPRPPADEGRSSHTRLVSGVRRLQSPSECTEETEGGRSPDTRPGAGDLAFRLLGLPETLAFPPPPAGGHSGKGPRRVAKGPLAPRWGCRLGAAWVGSALPQGSHPPPGP
jgi:hypothetical protein